MRKCHPGKWALASMVAMSLLLPAKPDSAHAATVTTVTVSAGDSDVIQGTLNNPSSYMNQSGKKSDATSGSGYWSNLKSGETKYVRAWYKPMKYYNASTMTYDYDYQNAYMDQISQYAERIILNVDQCDPSMMGYNSSTMTPTDPAACKAVLKNGIKEYKKRYPQIEYIEAFNEPDKTWAPSSYESPAVPPVGTPSPALYFEWYKVFVQVINEINTELNPAIPLKVGGPVMYKLDYAYLDAFLDKAKASSTPIGFISYHQYKQRGSGQTDYPGPAAVENEKSVIRTKLTNRGLNANTPVFVTEYGVFPGPSGDPQGHSSNTEAQDQLTQAAAMATLGYYYTKGGMDMVMHWTIDHGDNPRKDMFVDGTDGVPTPYFNMLQMQRMLKKSQITSSTAAGGYNATTGLGVNSMATKDNTGIAVMLTNYQWTYVNDGQGTDYDVTLNMTNLPSALFANKKIRFERYLVDKNTSNYSNGGAASAKLTKVEDYIMSYPTGNSFSKSIYLGKNAMSLVVLTPVLRYEAESQPTAASTSDTASDITDTQAEGGSYSKLTANAIEDYVQYTLNVPATGTYAVKASFKKAPDRGKFQLSVDGANVGPWIDQYDSSYPYEEVYIGNKTFGETGNKVFRFTVKGKHASSSGYTGAFDYVELVPLSSVTHELENFAPQAGVPADQDPFYYIADTQASGGKYVKFGADGSTANDHIRFLLPVKTPGTYKVYVNGKFFANRGKYQLYVDGNAAGSVQDQYASTAGFQEVQVATVTFDTAGVKEFKFQVTGKHAASTGYELSIDAVRLQP